MRMVREAVKEDLHELLGLYLFLHETDIPENSKHLENTWKTIIEDENHHIIVNEINGKIISSCVCVIIPNLTRSYSYGFSRRRIRKRMFELCQSDCNKK